MPPLFMPLPMLPLFRVKSPIVCLQKCQHLCFIVVFFRRLVVQACLPIRNINFQSCCPMEDIASRPLSPPSELLRALCRAQTQHAIEIATKNSSNLQTRASHFRKGAL